MDRTLPHAPNLFSILLSRDCPPHWPYCEEVTDEAVEENDYLYFAQRNYLELATGIG